MSDRSNSKSKKRKLRNQRRKHKRINENIESASNSIPGNVIPEISKDVVKENYKVDFPEIVESNVKLKAKSRSLDDDDESMIIEELTECHEEVKYECEAIVSEADSDWEEVKDLTIPDKPVSLSTTAISIDEEPLNRTENLSPQEELCLRNFLEGINLVNAPEIKLTASTLDSMQEEKMKKREALLNYFSPLAQKPRYLDIISEEGSDELSDRDTKQLGFHLKQGTPETELPPKHSITSPKVKRKSKMQRLRPTRRAEEAVLVCTKIVDTPSIIEHIHSSASQNAEPEKVFLDSSSDSMSSKSSSDSEETEYVIKEEVIGNISSNEISADATNGVEESFPSVETCENLDFREEKDERSGSEIPSNCSIFTAVDLSHSDRNQNIFTELTPPPTPEASPKLKLSANSSMDLEDCIRELAIDTAKDITTVINKLSQGSNELSPINTSEIMFDESVSSSESSGSSRRTSPSTIRLNPMNSSVADVTSILPDLELAKEALAFRQPECLRKICLNFLLSLPCGAEILQELSDISLNLDKLTQALELTKSMFWDDSFLTESNECSISEGTSKMWSERWTGLPFKQHPNYLLYVSPSQKNHLDDSEGVKNEPDILFDLHTKFMERLEANQKSKSSFFGNNSVWEGNDLYSPENTTQTLPKNFKHNPRLGVSNLGDWLKIARSDGGTRASKRRSLPDDIYKRQMEYILEKEKEIEKELEQLLQEKKRLFEELEDTKSQNHLSCEKMRPKSFPPSISESFRQEMYEEYMGRIADREERKQHKVIKITSHPEKKNEDFNRLKLEVTHPTGIEDEFMKKVQELHGTLEIVQEEVEQDEVKRLEPILIMDGDSLKEVKDFPKHLREFVDMASEHTEKTSVTDSTTGVWSPGQRQEFTPNDIKNHERIDKENEILPTVWQPKSAASSPLAERKEFRAVNFESPKLSRKNKSEEILSNSENSTNKFWQTPIGSDLRPNFSSTLDRRLSNSQSSPATGFNDYPAPRLPKAQNPTITLLQKAREGQLPKGANYLEASRDHYQFSQDSSRQGEIFQPRRNEHYSESDGESTHKIVDTNRRRIEGVGPVNREGMPLTLRSEIRDNSQSKWYKKMYDTIHKQKPYKDEYVTVRYKPKRAQYPYITGYLSEPEAGAYDSDRMDYKYATLDRRRIPLNEKENYASSTMPRNSALRTSASSDIVYNTLGSKLNPGRIENYTPGHSSISDQESKRWWNEVMDIFDGNFEQEKKPITKGYLSQALKESGYESDSTLIFRKKEEPGHLNQPEQREAYKIIQKGGDIPLHGLRKPAPEPRRDTEPPLPPPKSQPKPSDTSEGAPKKYVENQVTIHYKTPIRQEIKEYYSEDELAHRQQESMKKIYQEERRRKYLQELQDMHSRRHTDNFTPSEKSPIALNRYDDFDDIVAPQHKIRARSPEPRLVAKALYNFVGMTPRELTFRKGDNIYVRRQIDKNWYEGELNAMVGLFPVNYVEIIPYENVRPTPRKPHEGQARAKYNFLAKTHLELSLAKGEMVIITRRVDNNWYEGKIGGRRGIFPASYVDVLIDPQEQPRDHQKPVAAPAAHSLLLNGSSLRESMGSHTYTPNIANPEQSPSSSYFAKPVQINYCNNFGSKTSGEQRPVDQALHIDTQTAEPSPYKALYKYLPQNDDELELMEGDTVFVLEKCDDGWFVGSNERTGAFGTFPGNYVDKV